MKNAMFAILLVLTSCKTDCKVYSIVSTSIENSWGCQGKAALESDVNNWLASANLCTKSGEMTGVAASLVCPLLISQFQKFAGNKVPATWQCDPSKVGAVAADGLSALCSLIPF